MLVASDSTERPEVFRAIKIAVRFWDSGKSEIFRADDRMERSEMREERFWSSFYRKTASGCVP